MTELRADCLSPIDTATLWPQLGRLGNEVLAPRSAEHLLLNSALAATGLQNLPRMPRTAVLGVKRGLGYRGVLVARELDGGAGWEAISLRLARPQDDDTVTALAGAVAGEAARRGGRTLYARVPQGSPHYDAIRRTGLVAYGEERLLAMPGHHSHARNTLLRSATRHDRPAIFRLYCRAVPENIRRQEAATQQDWRAFHGSFDCDREYVLERNGTVDAWAGIGPREAHVLSDAAVEGIHDALLDLIEAHDGRHATLVAAQYQFDLQRRAEERGYALQGARLLCARRLAALNSLKEVAAAGVETVPLPN